MVKTVILNIAKKEENRKSQILILLLHAFAIKKKKERLGKQEKIASITAERYTQYNV